MSDYYTESQVDRIAQDAHDGAILEAGKEWERQRDEFNSIENELETRIAELETFIDQLIEAGNAVVNAYPTWVREEDKWDALVKDWKERER